MCEKDLSQDMKYVEKHREELLKTYANKYLLIYEQSVVNSYDTYEAAATEGIEQFGVDGIFLVYEMFSEKPVNFVMEAIL